MAPGIIAAVVCFGIALVSLIIGVILDVRDDDAMNVYPEFYFKISFFAVIVASGFVIYHVYR